MPRCDASVGEHAQEYRDAECPGADAGTDSPAIISHGDVTGSLYSPRLI
jgi:hypothetical protein